MSHMIRFITYEAYGLQNMRIILTFNRRKNEKRPRKIKKVTCPHTTPKQYPNPRYEQIIHWPVSEKWKYQPKKLIIKI